MKKNNVNNIVLSIIILLIFNARTISSQDFNVVTDEQLFFFLKQWPECNANKNTKKACDSEISMVRGASPRIKRDFFKIINSFQDVAIKAGNSFDKARKKAEDDLSNFLKTEFSVDIPEEVNSKEYPELIKFIKKYGLPRIFSRKVEKLKEKIERKIYKDIKDVPTLFLKNTDINRIINAERMRKCIEMNKLDELDVPKKYLGKVGNSWNVFAEKINISKGKKEISLKQIQQLIKLSEETGFTDWKESNLGYDENDKLIFTDTENISFGSFPQCVEGINLPSNCKAGYIINLLSFYNYLGIEGQAWLRSRIKELMHSPEGVDENIPISFNTKYDDPEIDFEKVKKEFEELQKSKNI